jgi:hypothetical protein
MVRLAAWPARRWIAMGLDAVVVVVAYLGTLLVRFDGGIPSGYWANFLTLIPLVLAAFLGINLLARTYSRDGAIRAAVSGFVTGIGIALVFIFISSSPRPLPLSVLLLGALGSVVGFVAIRLAIRP